MHCLVNRGLHQSNGSSPCVLDVPRAPPHGTAKEPASWSVPSWLSKVLMDTDDTHHPLCLKCSSGGERGKRRKTHPALEDPKLPGVCLSMQQRHPAVSVKGHHNFPPAWLYSGQEKLQEQMGKLKWVLWKAAERHGIKCSSATWMRCWHWA